MRDDDSYNLRKLFEEIELDLIKSMKRTFKRHEAEEREEGFKWEQWQSAKLRNIREYRNHNKEIVESKSKEIEDIVNKALDSNYKKGENFFSKAVKKIGNLFFKKKRLSTPKDVSDYKTSYTPKENDFFAMNDKKLDAMKEVINNDLKKGQNAILRRMDDVYRQTVYKAEIHMTAGAKTLDQAIDMATKEFLNKGIDCIEYKDGKRVNIASYAEMALRTASHRATLLGEGKKRDEWDIHTVVVSAHGNTCPKCEKWQGEVLIDDVFSRGTLEEAIESGYYLLSFAIKSGLLHPNCRHTISTYFPGITQIPTIPDGKEAIKKYEAEQEQRRLEREIKKWKRIAEGSQDPDNINSANNKVGEYQKELRDHLEKHPYLRRDYSREKTRGIPATNYSSHSIDNKQNGFNDKASFKIDIPGVDTKVLDAIADKNREIARLGSETGNEYMSVLDKNTGKELYFEEGIPGEVGNADFFKALSKCDDKSVITIHNHANNDVFSLIDLNTNLTEESIHSALAVGHDGTIYCVSGMIKEPGETILVESETKYRKSIIEPLLKDMEDGKIMASEYTRIKEKQLSEQVCKDYYNFYKKEETGGK